MDSLSKEMKNECNFMLPKGFSLLRGRFLLLHFAAVSETMFRTKGWVFTSETPEHITPFVQHLNKTKGQLQTDCLGPTTLLHTQVNTTRIEAGFSELAF